MCLVLAINHVLDVWHEKHHLLEVKHLYSLVFCECGVENVHAHCWVLDHCQRIQGRSNVVLIENKIHDHFDVCDSSLHDAIKSLMFFHALVNYLNVLFLVLGCLRVAWSIKCTHV